MTKFQLYFAMLLSSFPPFVQGDSMKRPDIKLNPSPRMRYEITAVVEGAPSHFEAVEGHADFKVTNEDCVPLTPITGATIVPEKKIPLTYDHVGENEYRAIVFLDQLQDEDYFGRGTCHWSVVAASIDLHHGATSFSPAIYHDDIVSQKKVVKYFSIKSYNGNGSGIDIGANVPTAYNNPSATFKITLRSAEKLQ